LPLSLDNSTQIVEIVDRAMLGGKQGCRRLLHQTHTLAPRLGDARDARRDQIDAACYLVTAEPI
jgi:hypothetical protein